MMSASAKSVSTQGTPARRRRGTLLAVDARSQVVAEAAAFTCARTCTHYAPRLAEFPPSQHLHCDSSSIPIPTACRIQYHHHTRTHLTSSAYRMCRAGGGRDRTATHDWRSAPPPPPSCSAHARGRRERRHAAWYSSPTSVVQPIMAVRCQPVPTPLCIARRGICPRRTTPFHPICAEERGRSQVDGST